MKKTLLHSAIAAVIATFAVASSAAVITVDGTQKPITDTTIGGLVVQNGGSAFVDADGKDVSFKKEAKTNGCNVSISLVGAEGKISSLTINAGKLNFESLSANKSNDGLSNFTGWQNGYSSLTINAGEITIGSAEKGGDRGFQFKNDYNTLEVHADKVVAYVLDGLINAQGTAGHSSATFGTASDRIGHFEAHTTYGKDDYGVALLQVNEGNKVFMLKTPFSTAPRTKPAAWLVPAPGVRPTSTSRRRSRSTATSAARTACWWTRKVRTSTRTRSLP